MPFYVSRGKLPAQRHTAFYKEDGVSLYREELFGSKGFSGIYSNKYHLYAPPQVEQISEIKINGATGWAEAPLKYYHFLTGKIPSTGNFFNSRKVFLQNAHCSIATACITKDSKEFYRNSYAHELLFVHEGAGELHSEFGLLPFKKWDYLVIPKGVTYQLKFNSYKNNKLLVIESDTAFEIPKHFRNEYGQTNEDAPYYERDFRVPEYTEPVDKKGKFHLTLKVSNRYFQYILPHHPFDVVGWDGYLYPFAFNIDDYAPKVGKLHLPPPSHLLFTTQHFVVCNFVPRLFDFHEHAIPAPYFHSNVDSDEVLYYVAGDFMSRTGVKEGSITLHPMGIPHGPQPGKTEASIGKKATEEYAVMIDTFSPLQLTQNVKKAMVKDYDKSWLE
ncbi:MAG: homogentisate 1,2-dioxygenase [Ignavibacteriales bacterium]|nr:homogentisate 1,2-dioxygenase [Ignavibacteriales bacterium]